MWENFCITHKNTVAWHIYVNVVKYFKVNLLTAPELEFKVTVSDEVLVNRLYISVIIQQFVIHRIVIFQIKLKGKSKLFPISPSYNMF